MNANIALQCDQHRREQDTQIAKERTLASKQHKRNQRAWEKKAIESIRNSAYTTATAQLRMAENERSLANAQ